MVSWEHILQTPGGGGGWLEGTGSGKGLHSRLTAGRSHRGYLKQNTSSFGRTLQEQSHMFTLKGEPTNYYFFVWLPTIVSLEEQKWETLASCTLFYLQKGSLKGLWAADMSVQLGTLGLPFSWMNEPLRLRWAYTPGLSVGGGRKRKLLPVTIQMN